jgi:hypothetical protein
MNYPITITFYTPEYKEEARRLEETCKLFNLPFYSYEKKSKGSWVHNCTMKAEVIQDALYLHKQSVLWIDADGRYKSHPTIFDSTQLYECDFGAYFIPDVWNQPKNVHLRPWGADRGNEALAGGTMFFNYTDKSFNLIDDWKKESQANPNRWEQQSLQKVWDKYDREGLKTYFFNQAYCKVFDCKWFEEEKEVVIEHTQASRRLKGTVR